MSSAQTIDRHPAGLIMLLAGLAMFGPFSIDTMFPMFGVMEKIFGITPVQMQQTVSVYLLAYGWMSLLHGPLSDAFGRRHVILVGVAMFTLSSIGCACSTTIGQLLLFRALQGFSAGSGLIVGRAIIRDRFHGADAQRIMSRVSMVFAVAPAIAPIIGGIVGTRWGWAAIFWSLALFSVLLLVCCWRWLPETHPHDNRLPVALVPMFQRYGRMLGNPRFTWLAFSCALNFSAIFIVIASAPVIVLNHLRLGPTDFAYLFIPTISGMTCGAYLSGRRAGRHKPESNIAVAYTGMFAAGLINVAYCTLAPRYALPWAVVPIFALGMGVSLAFPTLTLLLLDLYPQERGTASSMQTFIQLMISTLIAGVVSPALAAHPAHMALGSISCTLIGWGCWNMAKRAGVMSSPEMAMVPAK